MARIIGKMVSDGYRNKFFALVGLALVLGASGCGNTLNCAVLGDNLSGRITFANGTRAELNGSIVIEWSKDSFATVGGRGYISNNHGLLTFRYSVCVDNDVPVAVRAYQDENEDRVQSTGEASGRYDGTDTGDAAYLTKTVPGGVTAGQTSRWEKVDGADINLDVP